MMEGLPPIDGRTRVFAIIGDPIAQVRSPEQFNLAFKEAGTVAVMIPLQIPARGLDVCLGGLKQLGNLGGIVVTVPHKPAVIPHCDEVLPHARAVGAVNAIAVAADGRWIGGMFDGRGFIRGLEVNGHDVRGARVHLVGCGGAGSAIAFALAAAGVQRLRLFDVDHGKAERLAARVRQHDPALEVATGEGPAPDDTVVVNATPVGMAADDPLPIDPDRLAHRPLYADIIMKPPVTRMAQVAGERGCPVQLGAHMLDGQVAEIIQFFAEHGRLET